MSGELLKIFEPLFETLMGSRLLRGAYASIAIEKNCLESMPLMSNPLRMLHDLAQTSFYSIEFGKYMMHRVDSDDLQLSPVIDLILNKRQVAISVINSQLWSPCTRIYMQLFNRLVLPTQLSSIQNHFNDFYHYHYSSTVTTTHKSSPSPRRLVWCHGLGSVTLSYRRSDGRSRSIVVNEVQAAVLFLFNGPIVERTVMEIIAALHLDIHQLKAVVYSMAVRSKTVRPILEIICSSSSDDDEEEKSFHWNSVVRLLTDETCYGGYEEMDYSMLCLRCIDPIDLNIVRDWRNDKLDVYIIKILKAASRSSCSSHLMELKAHHGSISTYELVEMVNREVIRVVLTGKDSSKHLNQVNSIDAYSIDEVITRAEHLVSIGCIDKVSEPEQSDGAIYNTSYVYMSSSSSSTTSTSTSTSQQKENCDELPLFDRMQQLLAEYNYNNNNSSSNDKSLLLSEESVEPGTDNSSYSSHGDGEDKTDDFREEIKDIPLGGVPSSSMNAVVDVDYFSAGLINWVSSVCPNRTLPKLIRGGYPRVMTNDHTRTALYTSESLVESATDSQSLCGFTDPSSIPPINEEESKTHPAVGSRPSLSHSTSSRQMNRISIPERSMGSDGRKTVLSFPALYPQSIATSCSRADYFRQHESALETIHESSVYALGTLIQQVNLLLHEYSLNYYYESMDGDSYQERRRKRSFRIDPPSINTYITSLFKYFECARTRTTPRTTPSASAASSSKEEEDEVFEDNCELQKWMFFALPLDLTRHICDQFTRILINYSSNNLSSIAALREILSDPVLSSSSSNSNSRSTRGGEMDDCIIHLDLWKRNWLKTFDINFGQLSPTRIDGDIDTGSSSSNSSDGSDRRASPTALRMAYVWYVDNRNALETKQLAGISLCDFLCTCLVHANRSPSSSTLDYPLVYNRIFGGYPVDDALHSSGGSFVDSMSTSSSNPFGMDSCSLRFSGTTGQQRRKCKPRLKAPPPSHHHPPHHAQHSLMLSDRMEMMTMPSSLRQDRGLLLPSPDRSQLRGNTHMGLRDEAANYVSLSTYARNPSFVERSKDTMNSDRTTIIYSDGIYSSRHPSLKSVDSSNNSSYKEGSSGIYSYPLEGQQTRGTTTQCSSSRDVPLRDLVARYLTVFHSSLWETFAADLNRLPSARLSAIISADLRPELDELCHELLRSMSIRVASFIDTCRSSSTIPTDNHSPDTATATTKLWFLRGGISCSLDNVLQEAFSFLDSDNDGLLDERDFKHREATTPTKSDPDKRILKATTTLSSSSSSSPIHSTHRISPTCSDDNSSLSGHCYVSYEMMSSIDKVSSSPLML